jgi:8-oxo-dGTP pyrophosphatase MutT (NUDIX family)
MARSARSLREEAEQLRRDGWTYQQIAADWTRRYRLNPRVAFRLAHGLTQAQVAERWNELWPDPVPKTAKHISYWEVWPAAGGRAPSLDTLNKLAMIYQCAAGDLLGGEDYTHLDPAAAARAVGAAGAATSVPGDDASGAVQVLTVAIAVVVKGADVLLVRRRDDSAGLAWQFPAGVVKPGADAATVAEHETFSETGIHCVVRRSLGSRLHPATHVFCEYFFCEYLGGIAENRDVAENISVTWADRARLTDFIPAGRIFPSVLDTLKERTVTDQSTRPAIVAAIIVDEGRVLMVRRRVREGDLSWQFPAGELEPGESFDAAAMRETHEEVGLAIKATQLLGERIHPATGRQMAYVACDKVSGTAAVVDQDELDALAWCTRSELAERVPHPLFPAVQEYLDQALIP